MYIRVKTTPNSPRKSIQIVEGIRTSEGKVRQKIVRHVGVAMDDKELLRLKDVAEFIKANIENERNPSLFSPETIAQTAVDARKMSTAKNSDSSIDHIKNLREEQKCTVGIHEAYGKLYDELGLFSALPNPARQKAASSCLKNIVLARIANPSSKRSSVHMLNEEFGISIGLDQVYRMMDKLDDTAIDRIQDRVFSATKTLLNEKIDVLFYDCTTLYFESFKEDALKQNGYSKDLKFNQPQVLIALMVTEQGLPIGYEVFPGSMYEGHTLLSALSSLKQRFALNRVVFVADSGMLNSDNIELLQKNGFNYIVGARLRSMNKKMQERILCRDDYHSANRSDGICFKTIELEKDNRLIVSESEKRAYKDKMDREKAVNKLLKKGKRSKNLKSFFSNYGYKKYLKLEGEASISIDKDKLTKEAAWDGLHGIITNIQDLSPEEIYSHYRGLWQIEESFRITKHDLKVRPIFHWTPKRIKAHLAISYMAFACVRHMEYRVRLQYKKMSPDAIRKALSGVQISLLKHINDNRRFVIPSRVTPEAIKIYQAMGIKLSTVPYQKIT